MLWAMLRDKMLKFPSRKISEGESMLTYEDAVIFAENFGRRLTGPCYAILCQSELGTALAMLGCIAAGVTALPLSFRYGEQHIKRILQKIEPPFLITDIGGELHTAATGAAGYMPIEGEQPAVILCTSGTTGQPKGVMLSRENLLTNLRDISSYFRIGGNDRILICRPLYHCAVLTGEFLFSLTKGLDIVFVSEKFDPVNILKIIKDKKITVLCGTPSLLQMLCRFDRIPDCLSVLRHIAVSGECMTKECADKLRKTFYDAYIYHVYGLTEASPRVSCLPPGYFASLPEYVGMALPSLRAKIVGSSGKILPENTFGELCIKGKSVMMGYYGDPALTAKTVDSSGWLHTGDIASMGKNGIIKIKCRKDNLIIRAGMNIYPQEIENSLLADHRTEEVLAYGIKDTMCGEKIGLKIKGKFKDQNEVLRLCREKLPTYELPSIVEIVGEIPKNASGKIIRGKQNE